LNSRTFSRYLESLRLKLLQQFLRADLREDVSFLIVAAVVGVCAGLGAVVFLAAIDLVHDVMFNSLFALTGDFEWKKYLIPILPALGGLAVGLYTQRFSSEARGHGVPDVMKAVIAHGGRMRPALAVNKIVTSAISIGSGGGGGREGPIVQIGAAIGSALGQILRLSTERVRTLVGCGAAGGIAAIFNAPLGGMMFAMEIVMGEFTLRTFSPIVISSVLATAVSRSIIGNEPTFVSPVYDLSSNWELIFYLLLGVLAGYVSVWFTKTVYWCEDLFARWKSLPAYLKPMVGGFLTGIMIIWFPDLAGYSYTTINNAIAGNEEVLIILGVFLLKPLAAGLTLGSGGSGGVFTPALKSGAMLGALLGIGFNLVFPETVAGYGSYALVGMGAVVAGTMHAPLTAILMLFEITGNYQIILPIMFSAITATVISRSILKQSIYTLALERQGIRVGLGMNLNIIQNIHVEEVMEKKCTTVGEDYSLKKLVSMIERGRDMAFPVVAKDGRYVGVVTFQDVREVLSEAHAQQFLLVKDIMRENVLTLDEHATLEQALKAFEVGDVDLIPVISNDGRRSLKGVLRHENILSRYRKEMLKE
jgi:CIC family chloride channel protein